MICPTPPPSGLGFTCFREVEIGFLFFVFLLVKISWMSLPPPPSKTMLRACIHFIMCFYRISRGCHPRRNFIIRQKEGRAYGKIRHGDKRWRGWLVSGVVLGRRYDRTLGWSFHGNQSFLQNQRIR